MRVAAAEADMATLFFEQFPGNPEAQSCTDFLFRREKWKEHAGLVTIGDPDSIIRNGYANSGRV